MISNLTPAYFLFLVVIPVVVVTIIALYFCHDIFSFITFVSVVLSNHL
jgi:hypothetical protein